MSWFFTSRRLEEKDILERFEKLERAFKGLQLEWDEAYDKMRTLTARFTKRAEQIEKHERSTEPASALDTTTGQSAHLDPISRRILERRARLFPQVKKEATS